MQRIAFLGLGVMGAPMAGHLAAAGYKLTVYNRSASKADEWVVKHAGEIAESAAQAVADAQLVISCVGDDQDIEQLYFGRDGVLEALPAEILVIDHSSVSASIARRLDDAIGAKQSCFIDAPVSGGQSGAESGQLTIMCGGQPQHVTRAEDVLKHYARKVSHLGPVGSGQLSKMVNQICVAGVLQGLAEALVFAEAAGLESEAVIRAISKGAAQSWQMDHRSETMIKGEYDFGFAVDWMRKDLALALDEAKRAGVSLANTALIDQYYADVQTMGGGRWDTSALMARLKKLNGMDAV